MSRLETSRLCDRTKSSVGPSSCVGPNTDCTVRSITFNKLLEIGSSRQQVGMLKSPRIRTQSYFSSIEQTWTWKKLMSNLPFFLGIGFYLKMRKGIEKLPQRVEQQRALSVRWPRRSYGRWWQRTDIWTFPQAHGWAATKMFVNTSDTL